jgi:hypothetical protein
MAYSVTRVGTSFVFPIDVYQGINIKKAKYKAVKILARRALSGVTGCTPSHPSITKLITKEPKAHLYIELL